MSHLNDSYRLFRSSVGPLKSGQTRKTRAANPNKGRFPAGGYKVFVCVDYKDRIEESNEKNNCKRPATQRFYVAYPAWTGLIQGTGVTS